jgi:hypothetical protein
LKQEKAKSGASSKCLKQEKVKGEDSSKGSKQEKPDLGK